jgi:hypothetical protein
MKLHDIVLLLAMVPVCYVILVLAIDVALA